MTSYVDIQLIKAVVGVCAIACMYYQPQHDHTHNGWAVHLRPLLLLLLPPTLVLMSIGLIFFFFFFFWWPCCGGAGAGAGAGAECEADASACSSWAFRCDSLMQFLELCLRIRSFSSLTVGMCGFPFSAEKLAERAECGTGRYIRCTPTHAPFTPLCYIPL